MKKLQALVHSQQRHSQAGGDFIGSLVWWSLNGNRVTHLPERNRRTAQPTFVYDSEAGL